MYVALGPAWPTAGPACGSADEGLLEPEADHAALGTSATAAMIGSGAIMVGVDEPFPFAGCPQNPQNASPSLTNELQLPQLFATQAPA
jgi:hypothetical protein